MKQLKLGVVGFPIKHSLSPVIHRQFARQFEHRVEYEKYQVEPSHLEDFVKTFFAQGGNGLNLTLPHKQSVIPMLEHLTAEAKLTGSVNTIYAKDNGQLVGDTTDGRGLLLDLKQKNFQLNGKSILVVGAGGAAASILSPLLCAGAKVKIYNRTEKTAIDLIKRFSKVGEITLAKELTEIDGLISTVSQFNTEFFNRFKPLISQSTFCYDLNYGDRAAELKRFFVENDGKKFSDGIGMLIGQAAYSYQSWSCELADISRISL